MARGNSGYQEQAAELIERYESLRFTDKHEEALPFLPAAPSRVLDVGAGTGADAAWLAERGTESSPSSPRRPFGSLGSAATDRRASSGWTTPCPCSISSPGPARPIGLVMLTAVWMHLDGDERRVAMPRLAGLLAPGATLAMSVRHGPVPPGRIMFEAPADEAVELARKSGLACLLRLRSESKLAENRATGVSWTRLVFRSPASGLA